MTTLSSTTAPFRDVVPGSGGQFRSLGKTGSRLSQSTIRARNGAKGVIRRSCDRTTRPRLPTRCDLIVSNDQSRDHQLLAAGGDRHRRVARSRQPGTGRRSRRRTTGTVSSPECSVNDPVSPAREPSRATNRGTQRASQSARSTSPEKRLGAQAGGIAATTTESLERIRHPAAGSLRGHA